MSSATTIAEATPMVISPVVFPVLVRAIVVHTKAHLDELVAAVLLLLFGEKLFPGISTVGVEFWDRIPDGETLSSLENKGYLLIGFAGSRYDEHPDLATGKARVKKQSAASLVANDLGVAHLPALQRVLRFTTSRDLGLAGHFEFSRIIKDMNYLGRTKLTVFQWMYRGFLALYNKGDEFFAGGVKADAGPEWAAVVNQWVVVRRDDPAAKLGSYTEADPGLKKIFRFTAERLPKPYGTAFEVHAMFTAVQEMVGKDAAIDWAFEALDALYERDVECHRLLPEVKKTQENYFSHKGKKVTVYVGLSDSPYFVEVALFDLQAGVVIQKNHKGNASVRTNKKLSLDLSGVAKALRTKEFQLRGEAIPQNSGILLEEGTLAGWHFFPTGKMVLNGSLSHYAPPTKLSLGMIMQMVCSEVK